LIFCCVTAMMVGFVEGQMISRTGSTNCGGAWVISQKTGINCVNGKVQSVVDVTVFYNRNAKCDIAKQFTVAPWGYNVKFSKKCGTVLVAESENCVNAVVCSNWSVKSHFTLNGIPCIVTTNIMREDLTLNHNLNETVLMSDFLIDNTTNNSFPYME